MTFIILRFKIRHIITIATLTFCALSTFVQAQSLPDFEASGSFNEQQMLIENSETKTRILINAPLSGFEKDNRVLLVFFALPNGNTIEQTFGKVTTETDDWHFNIQHIGAQTRFLRRAFAHKTIVVVYLETEQKSWPFWTRENSNYLTDTKNIIENITDLFSAWNPEIVLNSHSGGGRFIFNYLDEVDQIPSNVKRIAFLDSNYGYEDLAHGSKLVYWLSSRNDTFLSVMAYNDSVVVYNGKPIVSPTGGTWYRSKLMKKFMSNSFPFTTVDRDSLLWHTSLNRRIEFILKTNPNNKIYHTVQVERNGFIHSIAGGTALKQKEYLYFAEKAYEEFISDSIILPKKSLSRIPID